MLLDCKFSRQINPKHILRKNCYFEDSLYRYLYQRDGLHGDQKRQGTEFIWSKKTYRLDRIAEEEGTRVLDYYQDRACTDFVREELMHILEHTQALLSKEVSGSKEKYLEMRSLCSYWAESNLKWIIELNKLKIL